MSPEALGGELGVSGATLRRWERGTAVPSFRDIMNFGAACSLSSHQVTFLRTAFNSFTELLPPDPTNFQSKARELLTARPVPMVLLDELMYIQAWNSYAPVLGPHVRMFLEQERHPLEYFLEAVNRSDGGGCPVASTRIQDAIRSFWRFCAHYSNSREYDELIERLSAHEPFAPAWLEIAECDNDFTSIDPLGVAALLLPTGGPTFSMSQIFLSLPPIYTVVRFQPSNDEALHLMDKFVNAGAPEVVFRLNYSSQESQLMSLSR